MRCLLGLDVGTKTIGIAISDSLQMLAHPICTIKRKGVAKDVQVIVDLLKTRDVELVVVGLPFELDGSEKRSARLARQIGEALRDYGQWDVEYEDERYSSVEAERNLIDSGVRRDRRKRVIDQAAAIVILQSFLDTRQRTGDTPRMEE